MDSSGAASASTRASPTRPVIAGRRWTIRLHRNQNPAFVVSFFPKNGMWSFSMFRPTKPRTAGSSVSAASIIVNTTAAPPMAMPWRNARPMSSAPSSEMTTTIPANSTARPAVSIDRSTAASGSRPSRRPRRYRVTMNSE